MVAGLFSGKGSDKAALKAARKAAQQVLHQKVQPILSMVMGKDPGSSNVGFVLHMASIVRNWLYSRFTSVAAGQKRIHIDYVVAALGALCGYECFMTARRYLPTPQMGEGMTPIAIVKGANGDSYLFGDWINQIIGAMLAGIIDAAGLNDRFDYSDIIKRTAERVGGEEYWHVNFPNYGLITDAPKSLVQEFKHIETFETVYAITPVPPEFRWRLRPCIYAAAFVMLLEDTKTAPSNVELNPHVVVRLFTECFYPCAHFEWE